MTTTEQGIALVAFITLWGWGRHLRIPSAFRITRTRSRPVAVGE